ncbi:hypothetical protein V8G54_001905 [Vigna mungo]|uniref:Uncharacterized protein n=1 Tax=Vigna mungo TaxID=3915 RepID=A0AAQ3P960_VIGMU
MPKVSKIRCIISCKTFNNTNFYGVRELVQLRFKAFTRFFIICSIDLIQRKMFRIYQLDELKNTLDNPSRELKPKPLLPIFLWVLLEMVMKILKKPMKIRKRERMKDYLVCKISEQNCGVKISFYRVTIIQKLYKLISLPFQSSLNMFGKTKIREKNVPFFHFLLIKQTLKIPTIISTQISKRFLRLNFQSKTKRLKIQMHINLSTPKLQR